MPVQPPPSGPADGGGPPGGHPLHAVTDASGYYILEAIPAGSYSLRVFAQGYTGFSEDLDLSQSILDHTVLLQPIAFGALTGTVVDAQTLAPVAGAMVRLSGAPNGPGNGHPFMAMTDAQGYYHFDAVPQAHYGLQARKQGYAPFTAEVDVTGTPAVLDINLVPLAYGAVEGIVTDAQTLEPLEGVQVVLGGGMPSRGHGGGGHGQHFAAITDAQGFYHIDQVPAGQYALRAGAEGYVLFTVDVTIAGNETLTQDVVLTAVELGTLTGVVFDEATSAPLENALVVLFENGGPAVGRGCGHGGGHGGGWGLHAFTDAAGAFTIEDIPTGEYEIRVFAWGYAPYEAAITITVGANQVTVGLQGR
jgi:large repetitive protein